MPYVIGVDAFTQTVPKNCEQACQAVVKVEEKGCQTIVGQPIADRFTDGDGDGDDRVDEENIPQENFRTGTRNFHHSSTSSRSPRRAGIENRKHSSSKSDSDDKSAVKIVYNTDPNDSNTPSESSALITEPKDSHNEPMTDDETLELTGNAENSGPKMNDKNSGTPKTPMKKVNREDNGVELDHQGEHPLKLDNCNLQYANGRPFQVYCQGRSISKADQQLILNDLIEERKPSNMYKCKYHTDCKDPQGNHISKKNVQLHISRFIFTFRCRACSHKSSTSSNFLKHMRRCK